jgi:hypothetical protein
MLAVIGTVPQKDFPLTEGEVTLKEGHLLICGRTAPVLRGTPALLAASIAACSVLGIGNPYAFLAGDIGTGNGSRCLYEYLTGVLPKRTFRALTFHYLQPDVDWHNKVLFSVEEMTERPLLIADAGFMYVAKMSGQAPLYDLFTPDVGEMAFLADEEAPHPFYTRGFLLHEENQVPKLIERAYLHDNASRMLIVKGKEDLIATKNGIGEIVREPVVENLEPIGGTGDTLTGIVSVLAASGMTLERSSIIACRTNRLAGLLAMPTPATQVSGIIERIPEALSEILKQVD